MENAMRKLVLPLATLITLLGAVQAFALPPGPCITAHAGSQIVVKG